MYIDSDFAKNDITQDATLLDYLDNQEVPLDAKEKLRCQTLARHYVIKEGELWYKDVQGMTKVPNLHDQHLIIL